MNLDAAQIELYLLESRGWVSAQAICDRFGITDKRELRAHGNIASVLDPFAFTHPANGIIHHRYLSQADFIRLDNGNTRFAVALFRKRKARRIARRNCLAGKPGALLEIHSGQTLLSV